jgi:hypothetical protein
MRNTLSALLDWVFLAVLALLACLAAALIGRGPATLHFVQTAATAPITIARDAMATPQPQQYIDHAEWTHVGDLVSLRVYPTQTGRDASAGLFSADAAWAQVLAFDPDADTPGMREQFVCHWRFAELMEPGKTSWNLEPWRPIVNGATMIESRCNPGAAEESL